MRTILTASILIATALAHTSAQRRDGGPWEMQGVKALIDSVLEVYGGTEALADITAYRMEGSIVSRVRGHGTFTRLIVRPDRLEVVLNYPGNPEIRVLRGERGKRSGDGRQLVEVEGPLLGSMKLQAARSMVPWILHERRSEVRSISPLRQDRRQLTGLQLDLENGLVLRIYVDPESHHVVQTQGLLDMGAMVTHFETVYSDYRKVGGVLFAWRETNFASGVETGSTVIENVTLNPETSDEGFVLPQ